MRILTTEEAATRIGMKPQTLRNWRRQGKGPDWVKISTKVFYEANVIDAYIDSCRVKAS